MKELINWNGEKGISQLLTGNRTLLQKKRKVKDPLIRKKLARLFQVMRTWDEWQKKLKP